MIGMIEGPFENGYKRLSPILRGAWNGEVVQFWCPACDDDHNVRVLPPNNWLWDGNVDAPTFYPSVKTEFLKLCKDAEGRWTGNWVMKDSNPVPMICHSFVENGMIRFLGDCTHEYANQTLPLEIWYTEETEGLPGRPRKS